MGGGEKEGRTIQAPEKIETKPVIGKGPFALG